MLKLKRYLKPYWVLLVCAMVFLFGQAMLELTLPKQAARVPQARRIEIAGE